MKLSIIGFILAAVLSCNGDDDSDDLDCSTVLCTGRPTLTIDFVDVETGEQLLIAADGMFPDGLTVFRDGQSASLVAGQQYVLVDGFLLVYQITDQTRVVLENSFDVTITATVAELSIDECCPSYSIDTINTSEGTLEILDGESALRISL